MFMVSYWEHMDVINTVNNGTKLNTFMMMIQYLRLFSVYNFFFQYESSTLSKV